MTWAGQDLKEEDFGNAISHRTQNLAAIPPLHENGHYEICTTPKRIYI